MAAALHWFRRDLRVRDNTGLYTAALHRDSVAGVYVIDSRWFPAAAGKTGRFQAQFMLSALRALKAALAARDIPLFVLYEPDPVAAVLRVARRLGADVVTLNKDYEPDQVAMDERLAREAAARSVEVRQYKDAVLWEEHELLTQAGAPYTVFSPYKRAFLLRMTDVAPVRGLPARARAPVAPAAGGSGAMADIPSAPALGFSPVQIDIPTGEAGAMHMLQAFCDGPIAAYKRQRDIPAAAGVSRLSAHLSHGTISPRQCLAAATDAAARKPTWRPGVEAWISQLVWRDFYRMILYCFPHTVRQPFNQRYKSLSWSNPPALQHAWETGATGYPIVDAAMRQMLTTGFMHNRLRMITAMFLTKDMDVHWMRGENFFMRHLMDYDQASNVGGWQWSASTGTDAAPYFRVMNPVLQGKRWDPGGQFIRGLLPALVNVPDKFIHDPWNMPPEVQRQARCVVGNDYPAPVVDHAAARAEAIRRFGRAPAR